MKCKKHGCEMDDISVPEYVCPKCLKEYDEKVKA